jgi:hypothetical protein
MVTLRFFALPSDVLLSATGSFTPMPELTILEPSIPLDINCSLTEDARFSDKI